MTIQEMNEAVIETLENCFTFEKVQIADNAYLQYIDNAFFWSQGIRLCSNGETVEFPFAEFADNMAELFTNDVIDGISNAILMALIAEEIGDEVDNYEIDE